MLFFSNFLCDFTAFTPSFFFRFAILKKTVLWELMKQIVNGIAVGVMAFFVENHMNGAFLILR